MPVGKADVSALAYAQREVLHASIRRSESCPGLMQLDDPVWLPGSGSTRHSKPAHTKISPIGGLRLRGWFWHNVRSHAGFACNAETSVQRRYESTNGSHYGCLPDPMDLLRLADSVAARDRLECDRGNDQFPQRCRIFSFCTKGEKQAAHLGSDALGLNWPVAAF